MIASLPMYDRPETRTANDRLWQAVRDELGCGPARLARGGDAWADWLAPELLLSQTCSLPYRTRLRGRVTLLGAPDLGLPGCPPGHYRSLLVVRADAQGTRLAEFAAQTLAYNEGCSQSGWAAPVLYAHGLGLRFGRTLRSGGHAASAQAVATGRADIAAIDAASWRLIRRHDDFADRLRVLCATPPTPGLPYITAATRDPAPIRAALRRAIAALDADARAVLGLRALIDVPEGAYLRLPIPPPPAGDQPPG
jgi:ABC-type phosphate/phosphonate transport system substrate-binding protein